MKILKKILLFSVCFVSLCCFRQIGFSYVLQGNHIIALMIRKIGVPTSLVVKQKQIILSKTDKLSSIEDSFGTKTALTNIDNKENADAVAVIDEIISYKFPNNVRSDINSNNRSDEIQKIILFSKHKTIQILDGMIISESEDPFEQYKKILLFRDRTYMENYLHSLSVDITISSLGQFLDQTAYIVGAKYPDETKAQLWVHQDTFKPFRFILPGGSYDDFAFLEIRFLNWQKVSKTWYPMRIEIYEDKTAIKIITSDNFKINQTFQKNFFNMKYLKNRYPMSTFDTKFKYDEVDEVKKSIDDFNKMFK